ncbi:glutaredoxin domain-containing protein [Pseudomonadota bacterium]
MTINTSKLKIAVTVVVTALSLLAAIPAHAQVYKWTDSNGKVHFGDRKPSSEKAEAVNVKVTPRSGSVPTAYDTSSNKAAKIENKKVVMYGTSWCPFCKKARNYFKQKGIPFVEYDVEKLPSRMREYKRLGGTGYPLILIGKDQKMQGFSISKFDQRYNQPPH